MLFFFNKTCETLIHIKKKIIIDMHVKTNLLGDDKCS